MYNISTDSATLKPFDSQSVEPTAAVPASPGNLSEMQLLRSHPDLGDQKLGRGAGAGVQASVCGLTDP